MFAFHRAPNVCTTLGLLDNHQVDPGYCLADAADASIRAALAGGEAIDCLVIGKIKVNDPDIPEPSEIPNGRDELRDTERHP
jgi:hypothetical protein